MANQVIVRPLIHFNISLSFFPSLQNVSRHALHIFGGACHRLRALFSSRSP